MAKTHDYAARLVWTGNLGSGTATYPGYSREYAVSVEGKLDLRGSADPMFRGDPELYNPEDLFVVAISSCHMLSYLALCARKGISVTSYEDSAKGTLLLTSDGGGYFEQVTLSPQVTIADGARHAEAIALHEDAHSQCYIASSCKCPIHHMAIVKVESMAEKA
jgi:organic hydroperoxide reductase OsmC/OhrA